MIEYCRQTKKGFRQGSSRSVRRDSAGEYPHPRMSTLFVCHPWPNFLRSETEVCIAGYVRQLSEGGLMERNVVTRDSPSEEREKLIAEKRERSIKLQARLKKAKAYHETILAQAKKDQVDKILLRFYTDVDINLEEALETEEAHYPTQRRER